MLEKFGVFSFLRSEKLTRFLTTCLSATSFKIWSFSAFLYISAEMKIKRTGQKSAVQHSLFWRYVNFSKLMRTTHLCMTSTFQWEYCQCFTFKRFDKFKLKCTSHGDMGSANYFGKISITSKQWFWPVSRIGLSWNFKVLQWINLNESSDIITMCRSLLLCANMNWIRFLTGWTHSLTHYGAKPLASELLELVTKITEQPKRRQNINSKNFYWWLPLEYIACFPKDTQKPGGEMAKVASSVVESIVVKSLNIIFGNSNTTITKTTT